MNSNDSGWGSVLVLGLIIWAAYSFFSDKTKHFFVTDTEIKAIANQAANEQIQNYLDGCKIFKKNSPISDPNCVVFQDDLNDTKDQIKKIENNSNRAKNCNLNGMGQLYCQ